MSGYAFIMKSPEETMAFGRKLAEKLKPGCVLTLEGDLGAGKTTFTKGIGKGLGVTKIVNSPTFTIIKEYEGNIPLFHMDAYRLEESDEDLGFSEYFEGEGVTVVEWAKFIQDMLPKQLLRVEIYHQRDSERRLILRPFGSFYELLCKELQHESTSH
ncbi:tRNA (adenosine(37)-N6)-threonylcarbamoyltransferase complex ATPase subunit type 1 TsaE [Bacillus hwajinpoensis]|uniref:tRNA threonylcarbamoyladenosine biosynthesis protein TsaE n=1 Tax=Guptibacillus hwajinpoensis TaxID=208199 RepID=A0A845F5P3_9BACL|nr:tRNA (adenosine(37)-N6)-threonylcarbamoyltransferase complex ATPase subunit type 1 TsaE [Pseudalkalibacillus hwajinpoensis]MYL66081.1 tRNA (adenosine(37)-N6)-threonylcarbamoyltransferase complex ATPase subunit type 1 TsaE [Pseudalkalibacillus hwajinpoensis]